MAVGWAPYRFGHWGWVAPWGWTWIDDAPWGFAPTHYGRWAYVGSRWGWVPGEIVPAPVYAPALVAFVGGSGFDLALSFGSGGGVAWFPLAPGEVFIPGYRVSATYIRSVNVTSVKITNVDVTKIDVTRERFANREVPCGNGSRPTAGGHRAVVTRALAPRARTAPSSQRRTPAPAVRTSTGAANTWAGPPAPTLRQQWQNERAQTLARQAAERAELERRQQAELATPPQGVSLDALRQREEQEREALDRRHEAERDAVDHRYRDPQG